MSASENDWRIRKDLPPKSVANKPLSSSDNQFPNIQKKRNLLRNSLLVILGIVAGAGGTFVTFKVIDKQHAEQPFEDEIEKMFDNYTSDHWRVKNIHRRYAPLEEEARNLAVRIDVDGVFAKEKHDQNLIQVEKVLIELKKFQKEFDEHEKNIEKLLNLLRQREKEGRLSEKDESRRKKVLQTLEGTRDEKGDLRNMGIQHFSNGNLGRIRDFEARIAKKKN